VVKVVITAPRKRMMRAMSLTMARVARRRTKRERKAVPLCSPLTKSSPTFSTQTTPRTTKLRRCTRSVLSPKCLRIRLSRREEDDEILLLINKIFVY